MRPMTACESKAIEGNVKVMSIVVYYSRLFYIERKNLKSWNTGKKVMLR